MSLPISGMGPVRGPRVTQTDDATGGDHDDLTGHVRGGVGRGLSGGASTAAEVLPPQRQGLPPQQGLQWPGLEAADATKAMTINTANRVENFRIRNLLEYFGC